MRIVVQKVSSAQVVVEEEVVGAIESGFVLLVGLMRSDTMADVLKAADKIASMRIMEDEHGAMNLALDSSMDAILSISQFTLAANVSKGNRPSFIEAMRPEEAKPLYEAFNHALRSHGFKVETGVFQAHMDVSLVNAGPITIVMDIYDGKVVSPVV